MESPVRHSNLSLLSNFSSLTLLLEFVIWDFVFKSVMGFYHEIAKWRFLGFRLEIFKLTL